MTKSVVTARERTGYLSRIISSSGRSWLSKCFQFFLGGMLVFTVIGCEPPALLISPIYTKDLLVVDKDLEGTWVIEEEEEYALYLIKLDPDMSYRVVVKAMEEDEEDLEIAFTFRLIDLGDNRYVDITGESPSVYEKQFPLTVLKSGLPFHLVGMLKKGQDTYTLGILGNSWIKDVLEKEPNALEHFYSKRSDMIFLTAKTEDLQAFLRKRGHEWRFQDDESGIFKRVRNIKPRNMEKSSKLKDISYTILSVNTYSPLKDPWGEYKVIVDTITLPNEALLREIALEIWRTEGTGFHEFNIQFYMPEMDTDEIPYAEAVVRKYGVNYFVISLENSRF